MRYLLSKNFTKISRTSGTVQNTSRTCTLEMVESDEPDTGVLILPLQKHSFQNTAIYLRCIDGWAEACVVPFVLDVGTSTGNSPSSSGSVAEGDNFADDDEVEKMFDDIFGSNENVTGDNEFNSELDNLFNP